MTIAIIAAMSKELALLIPMLQSHREQTIQSYTFHLGKLGGHNVVAMQCGIGKVNAAVGALVLIQNFHPDLVINTGVAGGTGKGASILDVVVATGVAYHDVWCGPGTKPGQAAACPEVFECSVPQQALVGLAVKRGLIASGDIFVSRPEEVATILSVWPQAMAVDMESAAIAHVCHLNHTPFLCIRVISDTPGAADNIAQYENFWSSAPQNTFAVLSTILSRL